MDTKSSLREETVSFDEAISGKIPEIATLFSVVRNDDGNRSMQQDRITI